MIQFLFWLAAVTVFYTYFGFPLLVLLRGILKRRSIQYGSITPSINVIIVAHNEAKIIGKKLDNLLSLDYPSDKMEIIVASDGSTDGTNEIVGNYENKGIKFLQLPRTGKIPALNEAVTHATADILIFSDANSMYKTDAIKKLVRPFVDSTVGGVAGNQSYDPDEGGNAASLGERLYWNFDQFLKKLQSKAGNVISATGAIYAIRRKLFKPVPTGVGDDAVISYRVISQGYRFVYEPDAVACETVAASPSAEFKRKVRVCVRGLQGLRVEPQLFNPFKHGFYSVQLFSHKLLRWLLPIPLLVLLVSSLWLSQVDPFFRIVAIAQVIFYGMALIAFLFRNKKIANQKIFKLFAIPFYFCLANVASLIALLRVMRGQRIDVWEQKRSPIQEVEEVEVG